MLSFVTCKEYSTNKNAKVTLHTRVASIPSPEKRDARAECLTFVLTRFN